MSQTPDVFCTQCGTKVTGLKFCPQCGRQIAPTPPAQPVWVPPVPPPRKSHTRLIVAAIVIIVVLVIVTLTGTYFYAQGAVNSLTVTCSISSVSNIGLTGATVSVTYGVNNPSAISIDSDWTISVSYPGIATFSSEQHFTTPAGSTSYPQFSFTISYAQALQITGTNPVVTLTESSHALIYSFSAQMSSTANSTSSASSLPKC